MKVVGEWLVLAERLIDDSITHNPTLVSCLDRISAKTFPSAHYGFAVVARFRREGETQGAHVPFSYRVVRLSPSEDLKVIVEIDGAWPPDSRYTRVGANFGALRLTRPEMLTFRIDYREDGGPWVEGPASTLEIVQSPDEEIVQSPGGEEQG